MPATREVERPLSEHCEDVRRVHDKEIRRDRENRWDRVLINPGLSGGWRWESCDRLIYGGTSEMLLAQRKFLVSGV